MSFSKEQILRMYPNTQYYVKNSNGGLLAGTMNLEDAKKYADKFKKQDRDDKLNNHLEIFVCDRNGQKLYIAEDIKENSEEEEFE